MKTISYPTILANKMIHLSAKGWQKILFLAIITLTPKLAHAAMRPVLNREQQATKFYGLIDRNDMPALQAFITTIDKEVINTPLVHEFDGGTPLLAAAYNDRTEMVELLLQHGADPNLANPNGATPLLIASYNGNPEIVKLLAKHHANIDQTRITDGITPLREAAQMGHLSVVEILLQYGADPNLATADGKTPLYTTAYNGNPEIVALLLQHGAHPNQSTTDGTTTLFMAASHRNVQATELLLEYGANPQKTRNDGASPLHTAAFYGCKQNCLLLLRSGADKDLQTTTGKTAADLARGAGHADIAQLIENYGE